MIVTHDHLEASLDRIRAMRREATGIHGPGSKTWELQKESAILLGGGRAALLQIAHPYVAHAIAEHSKVREDIQGRFQRTFTNVFAMTFGELSTAFDSSRRVHHVHQFIHGEITEDVGRFRRGHHYDANDSSALLWVHATLMDTVIRVYELLVRPLAPAEREEFYQASKMFAYLFGIPDEEIPADYLAFRNYFDEMIASDTIAVGSAAREIRQFLFRAPKPGLGPAMKWFERLTAGFLPPRLRRTLDMPWGLADRALYRASVAALRPIYRITPRSMRYFPTYVDARRRLAGRSPSPVAAMMDRAMQLVL